MIGAGIFSILGVAGEIAGNTLYVSFIVAGVVALLSSYSYAKLGVKYPSAGGPTEYLVQGFGDGILQMLTAHIFFCCFNQKKVRPQTDVRSWQPLVRGSANTSM